jgi:glycosyltransferase involved in cell wall biosynthesis
MQQPLVSVIIPCYNHGRYLPEAFESIWSQEYENVEIIVVDDGSTDDTKQVADKYPSVKYVYQLNKGLSEARNTGIKNSEGQFLIFLDADDWLLPNAINTNLSYMNQFEEIAFVSGAHEKIFIDTGKIIDEFQEVTSNHYWHFLQGNYIGMHATVMYRRSVFNQFLFDTGLKACEDYDLYLKISRNHPVFHHTTKIAAYRIHSSNMSGNIPFMLDSVLAVLDRQKGNLRNNSERKAFENGKKTWKKYYCKMLFNEARLKKLPFSQQRLFTFLKHQPKLALSYIVNHK